MDTYHRLIPKKAIKAIEKFKADLASKIAKANEELAQIKEYKFKV